MRWFQVNLAHHIIVLPRRSLLQLLNKKIREALVEYLRVNFTSTASGCYVVATIDNFSEIHWNTFNARLHIDSAVSQSIGERHDDEGG